MFIEYLRVSHVRPDVRPGVQPADGRRGRSLAARVSSAAPKKHLIEAAPFGRLDQMLRTIVSGGVWGGFAPPAKIRGVWGAEPPSKIENLEKYF